MNEIKKDNVISIWLFSGCLMIFLMILIGGITRLTGSGLSIVEWNVISGTIPPLNEEQWIIAFEKYKQFPQYQKINHDLELSGFKRIFFWEYIHRLWGRVIGLVFIIPFILFYLQERIKGTMRVRLLLIFFLGGLQGAMGWFMVMSGLADNPNVSHYRLAAHMVLALILLSLVLITAIQTSPYFLKKIKSEITAYKFLRILLLILVSIQILYGAFVAGMKAGFAYNTFPKMGNSWIPDGTFTMEPVYLDLLENGITLQLLHRWLGILLFFIVLLLWACDRIYQKTAGRQELTMLLLLMFLQAGLGIFTLLMHVPVSLAVVHQAVGILVFLKIVLLNFKFKNIPI